MKYLNFFKSTSAMILLFFTGNIGMYYVSKWYDLIFIPLFILSIMNVFIGIMITYNGIVAVNKRTIKKILNA